MDDLFIRFLKKIGIEDVEQYKNCSFHVNKNDKEAQICFVTITSKECFSYINAKNLLEKLCSKIKLKPM